MTAPWVSTADAALSLMAQATAIATRLGHEMYPWQDFSPVWVTSCRGCRLPMRVNPRAFRMTTMQGQPLTFRCDYAPLLGRRTF